MLSNYENFLKDFDCVVKMLFKIHEKYIFCKKGCSRCCENGDYPFSQTEFYYLTQGFIKLDNETKKIVQQKIKKLKIQKENSKTRFEHQCPFLIDKKCSVYKYRGIICRTFGLCYYDDKNGYVRLPECTLQGLNYSKYYDKKTKTLSITDVAKVNLRIDRILTSELAKKYNIECGEIRPLLDWLS